MESSLVHLAAILLGATSAKTGVVLYSIQNFHTWLSVIDELFDLNPALRKARPKWTKIAARLRALNDTRVRLAHHTAVIRNKDDPTTLRAARYDLRMKSKKYGPLTPSDIVRFVHAVMAMADTILDLVEDLIALDLSLEISR